jgi:hypothetical protein
MIFFLMIKNYLFYLSNMKELIKLIIYYYEL